MEQHIQLEAVQRFYVNAIILVILIFRSHDHMIISFIYLLDLASGTTIDWVYGTRNVPLAFVFEFRDSFSGIYSVFFFI